VLHEVLHRFFGPHFPLPMPPKPKARDIEANNVTNTGNMNPATTVTGDDAANTLSPQQLRFIQYKDGYPKL